MLNIQSLSKNAQQQFTFSDFFSHRRNNFLLMTESYDHLPFYDDINRSILQQILSLGFDQGKSIADHDLQELFRQINWQVNATLKKSPVNMEGKSLETGISLLFVLFRENRLTVVQFGRILCGTISATEKVEIGHPWENFSVKSRDALNLLGYVDDNIPVKIHNIALEPGQNFVAFSSRHAARIGQTGLKPRLWKILFKELNDDSPFLHCLIENPMKPDYRISFFRRLKPFQITAGILTVIILVTAAYWFWGRNEVETQLISLKERYRELERNQDPQKAPELLGNLIQSVFPTADSASIKEIEQNIRETMEITNRLVKGPIDQIGLIREWSRPMEGKSGIVPKFDSKAIYYGYKNNVCAIDKSTRKELWKYEADSSVEQILLTDANRLLVATMSGKLFSLKRVGGDMEWVATNVTIQREVTSFPIQLNYIKDRRLLSSVLLFPEGDDLLALESRDGKEIAKLELTSDSIQISEYDILEKCWYIVEGSKLSKIRFDVF